MIFHYDLYLRRKGDSGVLSPDGHGDTGQLSVDLKQTHKAELIFNLVLFNFLKINQVLVSCLSFLCNRMQWIPISVSAKSKQAQPRHKEWEGVHRGLPGAEGACGPRDSHPGNVPFLSVSVKECIPEPAQFNIVEHILKKFIPLGMLNLCPKISTENKGQDYAGLGVCQKQMGRPVG